MLYNKSAVKHRKPVTEEQNILARVHSPFRLKRKIRDEIRYHFDISGKGLSKLKNIVEQTSNHLSYDDDHYFKGIRTAEDIWKDEEGHCIEQNVFLYSALMMFGLRTQWMITKNPKGYSGDGLDYVGVHPFLIYKTSIKRPRIVDAISGDVEILKKDSFYLAKQCLGFREFVAFYLSDAGEDLSFFHKKHDKALQVLKTALKIDPNNYTIHVSIGNVYYFMDDYENAEKSFKRAVKIAPDIIDTHKAYGDFCFNAYQSPEHAVKIYKKVINKTTKDLEILHSLEKILKKIDEPKLRKKVTDMKEMKMKSKELKSYLD